MRVLICAMWRATEPSGICRTVVNHVRSLNEASPGCRVSVVIGDWQRRYFEKDLALGELSVDVIPLTLPNTAWARNAWYLFGMSEMARETAADLVHCSMPVPIRRSHTPTVVTVHDLYPYDEPENFGFPQVLLNRVFLRRSLNAADKAICVSRFTLERLRTFFPRVANHKAVLIPNSIRIAGDGCESAISPRKRPYVLAVAQHRRNKNLDLLVASFAKCKALRLLNRDTQLVIVGTRGPETVRLEAQVQRLSLKPDVVFLSDRTDAEMRALYRDCALFLTLSSVEGFDLPLGEALLHRARVVASDIPVHREIAGGNCEYVDLQSPDRILAACSAIAKTLGCSRPAAGSMAEFSTRATGEKLLEVYADLLTRRSQENAIASPGHLKTVND